MNAIFGMPELAPLILGIGIAVALTGLGLMAYAFTRKDGATRSRLLVPGASIEGLGLVLVVFSFL